MPINEVGPEHSLAYRKDVLTDLFKHVRGADSFYVLGAASMGKTRLLDFMMRSDVQRYHLLEQASQVWVVRVDMNRLPVKKDWYFYELLLSSLALACNDHENVDELQVKLSRLDSEVIKTKDFLLALRYFEMGVNLLCQGRDLKVCFLFDEFDETYKHMPKKLFAQLRAVRDANKNRVCYGMFLRNFPSELRSTLDNESFYELFSRNAIGLGPYSKDDALAMIQQLEVRLEQPLNIQQRDWLYNASGGHPGLIRALMDILISGEGSSWSDIILDLPRTIKHENVQEECHKIWISLLPDEQSALQAFSRDPGVNIPSKAMKLIDAKGLLKAYNGGRKVFFSLLFEQYIKSLPA